MALIAASVLSCNDVDNSGVDAHFGSTTQAVTGANDAPVLDATKSPTLAPMYSTSAAPTGAVGSLVSNVVDYATPAGQVDNVTDLDVNEAEASSLGIAITAADTTNGNWFYSTNGGTAWNPLGAVTDSSARLLTANSSTRLYFQATAGFSGAATITFRAWDGTSALTDTTTNGGTTAFSTATDTASLTVAAPITFRAATNASTSNTASTTLVINKPVGTAQNDFLIAGITTASTTTITAPGGWTTLVDQTSGTERLAIFTHLAGAAEGASYTFTFGASVNATGGITAFTGINTASPIHVSGAGATASSVNQTAPVLTTSVGNTMLVTWHAYASAGTWTPPAGMTEAVDRNSDTGTGPNGVSISANYLALATAGTTGTRTAVASNNGDTGITAAIVLQTANNAPVLDTTKSPALGSIAEDAAAPTGAVGTLVSGLVDYDSPAGQVDNFIDVNGTSQFGIAITAVDSTNCTWSYSLNGGTTWTAIPAVSDAAALPLAADANTRIYCQPTSNFNGTVASAITFRAWDMSTGTAGTLDSTSTNGGSTAYSTATDTASLTITAVNDAPSATNMSAPETYTEDTPLDLIDIVITDIDSTTVTATLTLANTSAGSLSAGTVGSTTSTFTAATGVWTATGPINEVNALLAGVIYTPASNFNTTFNITTTVSDGTLSATPGTKVMTGVSSNDPPSATNLNAPETYTEDTPLDLTDIVITDGDSAVVTATLTLSTAAAGTLSVATSGTTTSTFSGGLWSASGPIAEVNALLAGVMFNPATNFDANFTIATSVDDGTAAPVTGTKTMTASGTNDAPVLDGSKTPALAAVSEDAPAPTGAVGTLVSSLVDFATPAGQVDNVTDPDAGAQLGIAVTSVDSTNFTVFYSTNGGTTWQPMGAVTNANARLLAADANNRIYVQPVANLSGTFATAITFRAWDQSAGTDGTLVDTTTNGGGTAFSAGTDTITATVTAVNDAPTATNLSAPETYIEDTALNLTNIVVSDVDSANVTVTLTLSNTSAGSLNTATNGSVTSTFSAGVWTASGAIANVNALLAALTFTPATNFSGNFTIATSVTDGTASPIVGSKAMTGTAVNDAPSATNLFAQETYLEDTALDLIDIVVSDPDTANVTVTMTLSNPAAGSLNTGTSGTVTSTYVAGTGVWTAAGPIANVNTLLAALTFTPAANSIVSFNLDVSITDGVAAAVTGVKLFTGAAVNDPPVATNLSVNETYVENSTKDLVDIVVSDVDSVTVTATLTISNPAAGALTTGSSGSATSTYNSTTGVWTVTGLVFNVNSLLSTVAFIPAANFNATFTIATAISDGPNTVSGSKTMNGVAVNTPPSATNLSAAETYTEDTTLDLVNIVVTDADSASVTATLTLSNTAAGALSTATSGSTTSAYTAGTGVWTASGPLAEVNALLAGVTFVPTANFNAAFTVATNVTDGGSTAVTGTKAFTGVPVNDAPTATNLSAAEAYTEDTPLNLTDIVVTDVDGGNITATLTLSSPTAGALNTGTSGAVTSTYNAGTGVWSASGALANVNALLAGLTFTPAANFNGNFTVATSVTDTVAAALTGTKAFTGTAVNDAPVAVDDAGTVPEGAQIAIDVSGNDTDADDGVDPATVAFVTQPTHGTITAGSNGSVAYHHDGTDTTSDTFTYTIKDASGVVSNAATVTLTITPVADDEDADGISDDVDNCPDVSNATQIDTDGDGIGDKCDSTPGGVDSGCGCSGGGNPAGSWPLLGAIGLLFRRRRRR